MHSERAAHLQTVQPPDIRHVNLPTSIAVSGDGEEGAAAYNRRLLQSNAVAKRQEGQQIPPNRTIEKDRSDLMTKTDHRRPTFHSQKTSTGTSSMTSSSISKDPPRRQPSLTIDTVSLTPVRHSTSNHISRGLSGDYVSSSELSSWCSDRSAALRVKSGDAAHQMTFDCPTRPSLDARDLDPDYHNKLRSSSVDSVYRRFVRFTRRFTTTKTQKNQQQCADLARSKPEDSVDNVACGGMKPKGDMLEASSSSSSPWDLPPNYVDMIFTKNADSKSKRGERFVEGVHATNTRKSDGDQFGPKI